MQTLFSYDDPSVSPLNLKLLKRICDQIGNRPVAVIAITGKFRGGKSFACNALLRRLKNGKTKAFESEEIIGGPNGIPFETGYMAHTKGIQVWPELFTKIDENGKEIALLLFDTQGTFDLESEMQISKKISLITLLLSSFMVQNHKENIGAEDLDHISSFLALARKNEEKIGQNFLFLMRDHGNLKECGLEGGNDYLQFLKASTRKSAELAAKLKDLENGVEKLEAFMLPPPNEEVQKAEKKITAKECATNFLDHLNKWADHVVEKAKPKKISDTELTGLSFMRYVEQVAEHVKSLDLRGISSAFEATSLWSFELAKKTGNDIFNSLFEKINEEAQTESLNPSSATEKLQKAKEMAVEAYQSVKCIGSLIEKNNQFQTFQQIIETRCENFHRSFADRFNGQSLESAFTRCLELYENSIKSNHLLISFQKAEKRELFQKKQIDAEIDAFDAFDKATKQIEAQPLVDHWRNKLIKKIEDIHVRRRNENEQKTLNEELLEACKATTAGYNELLEQGHRKNAIPSFDSKIYGKWVLLKDTPRDDEEIAAWLAINKREAVDIFDNLAMSLKAIYAETLEERIVDAIIEQVRETELATTLETIKKDFTAKCQHDIRIVEFQKELDEARTRVEEHSKESEKELKKMKKRFDETSERQKREIDDLNATIQRRDRRILELEKLLEEAETTLATHLQQTEEYMGERKEERKREKRERKIREDPTEMRRREFNGESQKCSECREELKGVGFCCKACRFIDLCDDCKDEHEHDDDLVKLLFDDRLINYECDGCELRIRGHRYKCVSCVDYDLCESCVGEKHLHHRMLRIPRSAVWREKKREDRREENPFFQLLMEQENGERNRRRRGERTDECRQQ